MRILTKDTTFNKAAATILFNDEKIIFYTLAFLNSVVARKLLTTLNPTLNTNIKDVLALPIAISDDMEVRKRIDETVIECILISRTDWDSFETSWDFKKHPLV